MNKIVRTRFAPSPTGYMHIGNLRTALFAYLLAKSQNGQFILRIEDTDRERQIKGAEEIIYSTLRDAGLLWDEGPDIGGNYGPYIQSQRKEIYKEYAQKLVENGGAYYCFCSKERLEGLRKSQEVAKVPPKYDGLCKKLTPEQVAKKIEAGESYVIRQKIPSSGITEFKDEVYGTISVQNATLDDGILLKADGYPTYNFANVVDDHLMNITHVIRGSEYLSSSPRYDLLYRSFGWEIPTYIHVPPVMKTHDKKLSKREGDASYEDFKKKGYVKEAILNYIALLGWSPQCEREKYNLRELVDKFSVSGISKSPAIFDEEKLSWLSGEYIRDMTPEQFFEFAKPVIEKVITNESINLFDVSKLLQKRCEKTSEIPKQIKFFNRLNEYNTDLYVNKKMKTDKQIALSSLQAVLGVISLINEWTFDNLHDKLIELVSKLEIKNGQLLFPLRVALSGEEFTPGGGIEIAYILGKNESVKRMEVGIKKIKIENRT